MEGRGYSAQTFSAVSCSPQGVITGAVCFVHVLCAQALSEKVSMRVSATIMLRLILFAIVSCVKGLSDAWERLVRFVEGRVGRDGVAAVGTDGEDEGTGHVAFGEADASVEVEFDTAFHTTK